MTADNTLREPLAALFDRVPPAWKAVTDPFLASVTGQTLRAFVDARVAAGAIVFPTTVFRALELTAPADVRVVILGQDPYHGAGQAHGLAFSIAEPQRLPPSLRNILAEVRSDTGAPSICEASGGNLMPWAEQGVLLLNAALTVEEGLPQSHAGKGWEVLTDALLAHVAAGPAPVVFLLWGAAAQRKREALEHGGRHRCLVANHPSPLSARRPPVPFIGCRHFSRANALLAERRPGTPAVHW